MVKPVEAVSSEYLGAAIYGPAIKSHGFVRSILHLQSCFDMLHRSGNEADGPPGHYTGDAVAEGR